MSKSEKGEALGVDSKWIAILRDGDVLMALAPACWIFSAILLFVKHPVPAWAPALVLFVAIFSTLLLAVAFLKAWLSSRT
jgi:hypothetical protein